MTTALKTERKTIRMVFLGMGEDSKGKPCARFVMQGEQKNDGSNLNYEPEDVKVYSNRKAYTATRPGWVMEFEQDVDDTTSIYLPGRFVERWKAEGQVAGWEGESAAREANIRRKKRQKKEQQVSDLDERLAPLREAYNRLHTRAEKAIFLSDVILRIQKFL